MSEQEPRPLKATGDAPPELLRALEALGRDRDAERLARVSQTLGATLAGAGGAGGAGGAPAVTATGSAIGVKLGVIGLVLGIGAWALFGDALGGHAGDARSSPSAPAASSASAARVPPPAPVVGSPTAEAPAPPATVEPAIEGVPSATPPTRRAISRTRHDERASRARGTEPAGASTTEPSPTHASADDQPDETQARPPAAPAPSVAPSAPPPSELQLLKQAREAASSRPGTALQLLDQHARRFPSGLLVPEREVLAIEVLRRLGRGADAERRLQRFAARYPDSIHLRRLQRGASSPGEAR